MALTDKLTAIANAIRVKTGKTDTMTLDGMAAEIEAIETGGGGDTAVEYGLITRELTECSNDRVDTIGSYAFFACFALTTIDFPVAMSIGDYAFTQCGRLTTADFPVATSIGICAFGYCGRLTTIDFPVATSIGSDAFRSCSALTTVDFPVAMSIGDYAFYQCGRLTTANFPVATSIGSDAFYACSALTTADFPAATSIGSFAFYQCGSLTTADFPVATSIRVYAFAHCGSLTTLVLRSESMCPLSHTNAFYNCYHFHGTVDSTHNPDGLKDGYIYVPSALVAEYQAATNWSTFAAQFRALEDYTVDGTITGELDPEKI